MNWLSSSVSRFLALFRKRRLDEELDDELRFHLEMEEQNNVRNGMSAEEAQRQARLRLGGLEQVKESYRDQRGIRFVESLFQDLRYGLRMLAKNPGVTAVAVLALGLGIGANTAVFSVADILLLRPIDLDNLDRIIVADSRETGRPRSTRGISAPDYLDWRRETESIDHLSAIGGWTANLSGQGEPEQLRGFRVSPGFFPALGVAPALGRGFSLEEEQSGRDHVVVLSHQLWARRFASDPSVLGESIRINGETYEIIGVTPKTFIYPWGGRDLVATSL